jgi:hypothetical protein
MQVEGVERDRMGRGIIRSGKLSTSLIDMI